MQKQAPIVQMDFIAFYNKIVLKNNDKIYINWEDYY